tara:strand:+ start:789 stop:1115 length:327 start_codon:yes stop_codon:yes gene_type:complete
MNKVVKDGQVAVLVSRGYGAGWYSWNNESEDILFDPDIVKILIDCDNDPSPRDKKDIVDVAESKYGDNYYGGVDGLRVEWVDEGCIFRINECDGAESLYTGYEDYIKA